MTEILAPKKPKPVPRFEPGLLGQNAVALPLAPPPLPTEMIEFLAQANHIFFANRVESKAGPSCHSAERKLFSGGGGFNHRKRVILFWRIVGTEIGKKSAEISEPIKPEKRSARKCIFPEKLIVTFFANSTAQ